MEYGCRLTAEDHPSFCCRCAVALCALLLAPYVLVEDPLSLTQFGAGLAPVGEGVLHECPKARGVAAFQQVTQLVYHHVFQTFGRVEGQSRIDADAARGGLAAAPAASHVAVGEFPCFHSQDGFPLGDERRYAGHDEGFPLCLLFGCGCGCRRAWRIGQLLPLRFYPSASFAHHARDETVRRSVGRRHLHASFGLSRARGFHPQMHVFDAFARYPYLKVVH